MTSPRARRVPARIQEILAEVVGTLKDPRIGFVTITDVRTSSDFGQATVYYTVLPDDHDARVRTESGLKSASPVLRRELGARMRLRHVPELVFVYDPVPAQSRRIDALIDEVRDDLR